MIAISTDAHHLDQMWMIELGGGCAEGGWKQRCNQYFSIDKLKTFCTKRNN